MVTQNFDIPVLQVMAAINAPCEQSLFYFFLLQFLLHRKSGTKHMYLKKRFCLQGAINGKIDDYNDDDDDDNNDDDDVNGDDDNNDNW